MLVLKKITKDYKVADTTVQALKGVDLAFRRNELVSILGQSGCGKTTMLNIIGGLDQYTTGDLLINGRSTKEFNDADWDVYRNHRVGFIFQSYNLIPHQTILGNVELALTIAGMSKAERQEKAKAALDKVGLAGQYNKRPNQLSGGQCQRVAIARALVNDPEILLADEPTGALDTTTSVQVMDLIAEIAHDKLVIMVTHNPELAEQYSTRIVRLLDGELQSDSNPLTEEEYKIALTPIIFGASEIENVEEPVAKTDSKTAIHTVEETSVTTKKVTKVSGETVEELEETAAKTTKTTKLNDKQELRAQKKAEKKALRAQNKAEKAKRETAKMSWGTAFKLSLQNLFTKKRRTIMTGIAGSIGIIGVSLVLSVSIGVSTFVTNMERDMLSAYPVNIAKQTYDIDAMMNMNMNTDIKDFKPQDGRIQVDYIIEQLVKQAGQGGDLMTSNRITPELVAYIRAMDVPANSTVHYDYGLDMANNIYTDFTDYKGDVTKKPDNALDKRSMSLGTIKDIFTNLLKETEYAEYSSLIGGLGNSMTQAINSVDYIETQYHILDGKIATEKNEIMLVVDKNRTATELTLAQLGYYSQEEFINIVAKATKDPAHNDKLDVDEFTYKELMDKEFTWYPDNDIYTTERKVIQTPLYIDVLKHTALESDITNDDGAIQLKVVGILEPNADISFGSLSRGFYYTEALAEHMLESSANNTATKAFKHNIDTLVTIGKLLPDDDPDLADVKSMFENLTYNSTLPNPLADAKSGTILEFAKSEYKMFSPKADDAVDRTSHLGKLNAMSAFFGESSKMISLQGFGGVDLPNKLEFYANDFAEKDFMKDYLKLWNEKGDITVTVGGVTKTMSLDDRINNTGKLTVADPLAVVFNMVGQFINIVTYALIGFTSLSLIVSAVMIAIITYISVFERTKEIGIIRSLGGRKRDVSNLFNAETFILGAFSGLIGLIVTGLVALIINLVAGLSIVMFTWYVAIIMFAISVLLTVLSGFVPSRSAAKKDPVVALRTE